MERPTTLEEARAYRYGKRAARQHGDRYLEGRCAEEVYARFGGVQQCKERNGHGPHGLYCALHGKYAQEAVCG